MKDRQVFWMVELMEAWFLADRESLEKYYGQGFRPNFLPGNPNVETIPKQQVESALAEATRNAQEQK